MDFATRPARRCLSLVKVPSHVCICHPYIDLPFNA